jgi:hypothetical protein
MINPFYKTRLVFKLSTYIQEARASLLEDLVAYTNDPIRYKRRLRMLIQLSEYEYHTLKKIRDFETDELNDIGSYDTIEMLKREVNTIVDRNS